MHLIGIKKTLVQQYPWLVTSVYKAFLEAKALAMIDLCDVNALMVTLPWLEAETKETMAIMGKDFWSYGIRENSAEIEALAQYAFEQGLIDRKIMNVFNSLPENNKYIRGLISWMGFKQTAFYYDRDARHAGATKYTFRKMIRFASSAVFYFSKKPLKIATTFGFLSVAVGLLLSAWILYNKAFNPQYLLSGWTSVILAIIYFGGVQLLTIGILGHYIGSLFDEVKKRPEYIVDETMNLENDRVGEQYGEMHRLQQLQEALPLVPESRRPLVAHVRERKLA